MTEQEFERWIAAYIEIYNGTTDFDEFHPHYWAIEHFVDLEADYPEVCWTAITAILAKSPSERVLANLASGPLEELIELHGGEYIERIEKMAQENPRFRSLLHGVWETTDSDIWARVLRARLDS